MKKIAPFLLIVFVLWLASPVQARVTFQSVPSLFQEPELTIQTNAALDVAVSRARQASINWEAVQSLIDNQEMVVNLFNDVGYTFLLDQTVINAGSVSYIGHASGNGLSSIFLTVGGGQLTLDLFSPDGVFSVRYLDRSVYVISQIDQSAFSPELPSVIDTSILPPAGEAAESTEQNFAMMADGPLIDVLVAYTPAARIDAGGSTAIINLINNAVALANTTYQNSGVNQQIHLVGTVEVSYTESGNLETDLNHLWVTNDNSMDTIHALRDSTHADLVSLIIRNSVGPDCGMSNQMYAPDPGFDYLAFSVIAQNCAITNLSFPHELGHLMGAEHDWYASDNTLAPYPYAHGYVNETGRWRTIMAYPHLCEVQGFTCERLPYFSNPNILHDGFPMGVQPGTSLACTPGNLSNPECDAYNALVLNNTRDIVANYRDRPASEPAVLDHCGTIGTQTWYANEIVHRVTCNVTLTAGSTLTIEPGAIVKFNPQTRLIINGKLQAVGSSSQQITFTSYRDDTVGGDTDGGGSSSGVKADWGWIEFTPSSDDSSTINYASIRYGGYSNNSSPNYAGNLYLRDASPVIMNSSIGSSTENGIYVESSSMGASHPVISSSAFTANDVAGISMDPTSLLTLSGNTANGNGTNGVNIRAGSITGSVTWDQPNLPYRFVGIVNVNNGATLTIGPDMIFKGNPNQRLVISGGLRVNGAPGHLVYFTSYRDDDIGGDTDGGGSSSGVKGDWGWIEFTPSSDDSSTINYASIRYGGYSNTLSPNYVGNLYLRDASPVIMNSSIGSSTENGIYVESSSMGASHPVITGSAFTANDLAGISMDPTSLLTLSENTANGNGTNGVNIRAGSITGSVTWDQSNLPYRFVGIVNVNNGATLTIGPDMIFKGNPNQRLVISGGLRVNGAPGHLVHFTSYRDDTVGGDTDGGGSSSGVRGDWGWIEFTPSSDDSSTISYASIRYGGYSNTLSPNYAGNLYLCDASPVIQDSTITNSRKYGIYAETAAPVLICNDIFGNLEKGIHNNTPTTEINAENQWWGSNSGPYHPTLNPTGTGNAVSDGVDFRPWLAAPCHVPPSAPANLSALVNPQNQVVLSWQDNSDETEFRVERSPDGSLNWQEIGNVGTNVLTYTDTGLSCSSSFQYYRVRAYRQRDGLYSDYSNTAVVALPPCAPTNLSALPGENVDIDLTWQDNSTDETHFYLERAEAGPLAWSLIATIGPNSTMYTDTGFVCGAFYSYRIKAYRQTDTQFSNYSNIVEVAAPSCFNEFLPVVVK